MLFSFDILKLLYNKINPILESESLMIYSSEKIHVTCEDSKKIIASQPTILARYLSEDFKDGQSLNSSEALERSCKHSKLVLYHALKERGFTPSEINICVLFLVQFTNKILGEAILAFNALNMKRTTDDQIIHATLSELIDITSHQYIHEYDKQFNLYITSL